MRIDDFTAESSGRLVKNLQGLDSFVPNDLPPPSLAISSALARQVSVVDNLLGRLDGTAKSLPDRKIFVRSFVRREAQLSSYIENTYADYDEVARADVANDPSVAEPVRETLNAERAIAAGVHAVFEQGRPVTLSLLRQMHGLLLQNVRGHHGRGRFRQVPVYIGSSPVPSEARFVPPPPHFVDELMAGLAGYLDDRPDFPAAVRLALIHYQFETIHPFDDGNGRLGRALILLGLCQHKVLTVPLFNASLHFERNRQAYYDGFLGVSTRGDWLGWVSFFIEGLRVAAVESLAKLDELVKLRQRYHGRLHAARNSALLLKLVDELFVRPTLNVREAAKIMRVTYPAAQKSLLKLAEAKIVSEVRGSYPIRFIARPILKAVNAEPTRR